MYSLVLRDSIVKEFCANVDANLDYLKSYCNLYKEMLADNSVTVKNFIEEVAKVMANSVPSEVEVPSVSVYPLLSGDDGITLIDVALRNKYSSNYVFRMKKQIIRNENVFEVLLDFFKCSYIELINDTLVRHNLDIVNEKLEEVGKEAGNTFKVKIVSPLSNMDKSIASISDDEIVYVADEERALSLEDILLFAEESEFVTKELIKEAFNREVAIFAQAQTTPQFVGVKDPLIGYICDLGKLTKPYTLIKKVVSRNALKVRGNKETLAYYLEGKVYSIVRLGADVKEVVLKPFNIDTLETVDFDVLSKI